MVDICLITMPYAEIKLPSLALGLLQAILEREGFSVRTIYANMHFAEQIGLLRYHTLSLYPPRHGVAEWTFACIAFPDFHPDHDEFFDSVRRKHRIYRSMSRKQFVDMLWSVRADADSLVERIADRVIALNPTIVGCSSTFCQHVPSLAILRRVREKASNIVTMLGGANCESIMGLTTHKAFPWVDVVVSTEADTLITPLCSAIIRHGSDLNPQELPYGIFTPKHRTDGYPVSENKSCEEIRSETVSLDSLPVPNFDDFFATLQASPLLSRAVTPALTVETSRGCWWGQRNPCSFCGLNGCKSRFRSKSPDRALREFEYLNQRYGISRFEAVDNILDMSYFCTLLPRLAKHDNRFNLFYETKSSLGMKQVKLLRDAGVSWIQPGIESLDSHILGLMNKGAKAWHNIQLLKCCRQFGIFAGWLILHDVPGENIAWYDDMADILPSISHLQPPLKVLPILFYRFSRYHDDPHRYGLELRPGSLLSSVYPLPEKMLADLVYFFDDVQRERIANDPFIAPLLEHRGLERIKEAVRSWRHAYWNGDPPRLSMHVMDNEIQVTDTRKVASAESIILHGAERDLLLMLDEAMPSGKLIAAAHAKGRSMQDVQEALAKLKEQRLILEVDEHFIGLPLREPVPGLPEIQDFPGGFIDFSCDVRLQRNQMQVSG